MANESVLSVLKKVDVGVLNKRGRPLVEQTLKTFGSRASQQVSGPVFNDHHARVKQYITNWSGTRIKDINNTTIKRLRTTLTKGVSKDETFEQLAKRVERVFEVAKGSRAREIARTEVVRASNYATKEGYKQAGIEQKEWQATMDSVTREAHEELDGVVVDIDEPFEIDGEEADYPGDFGVPELDINCRCGVLPKVGDRALRGSRFWLWKSLDRARIPWERKMHTAMVAGFEEQRRAVMKEFESMAGAA